MFPPVKARASFQARFWGILHAAVHAEATRRAADMCRVASEQDASLPKRWSYPCTNWATPSKLVRHFWIEFQASCRQTLPYRVR